MKMSSNVSAQRSINHGYSITPSTLLFTAILFASGISAYANTAPSDEADTSDAIIISLCADPVLKLKQEDSPCYTDINAAEGVLV